VVSEYLVIYEHNQTGWGAYCPDLPGLGVAGATRKEVEGLIHDAIELHIESLRERGHRAVDEFKAINEDTHGHDASDALLVRPGQAIRGTVRRGHGRAHRRRPRMPAHSRFSKAGISMAHHQDACRQAEARAFRVCLAEL